MISRTSTLTTSPLTYPLAHFVSLITIPGWTIAALLHKAACQSGCETLELSPTQSAHSSKPFGGFAPKRGSRLLTETCQNCQGEIPCYEHPGGGCERHGDMARQLRRGRTNLRPHPLFVSIE